jgi:hypothetical protein
MESQHVIITASCNTVNKLSVQMRTLIEAYQRKVTYQRDGDATLLACGLFESVVCHLERGDVIELVVGRRGRGDLCIPIPARFGWRQQSLRELSITIFIRVFGQFVSEHELLSALIGIQLLHELADLLLHINVLVDLRERHLERCGIILAARRPVGGNLQPRQRWRQAAMAMATGACHLVGLGSAYSSTGVVLLNSDKSSSSSSSP